MNNNNNNIGTVTFPEITQKYSIQLNELFIKKIILYNDRPNKNLYILDSYIIKIKINDVDKGPMKIPNTTEKNLAQILNINNYKKCYYSGPNTPSTYIETPENSYIYKKMRSGNFNTLTFET